MNISKNSLQFSFQPLWALLIASMVATLLSACSSQNQSGPADLPSTLPPFDGTALVFEEGKYIRDEYCSRIFDYQKTTYGGLTIGIEDDIAESIDSQYLAVKVINRYISLYNNSPVPLSRPLTMYILSRPYIGECYSRDDLVFVEPDEFNFKSYIEELLGAGTGISEYWAKAGLTSLALGEETDSEALKTWYQNTDDLDMTGLFIARFNLNWVTKEEEQIARLSATSLVQYALEVENIQPDLLVEQVNNDIRTRWLESLGVVRTVTYPYDGRFTGFTYSKSDACSLIVQADSMHFCLNRLPDMEYIDEVSEAEFIIDHVYYGYNALTEYLLSNAPSINHLMDYEETISVEVMEEPTRPYLGDNTVRILNSDAYYYPLYKIVTNFGWTISLTDDAVWMTVGFYEYLGKLLPIYPQMAKSCVFEDLSGLVHDGDSNVAPGTSSCYFLDPEQHEAAQEWYLAQGGQMENEESVDPRLYTDAVVFASIYREPNGGNLGIPFSVLYKNFISRNNLEGQEGLELSSTQATSFVAWLCDTYSIDRVLDVYINHVEDGQLDGKPYEELKSDWLADLVSKGEGIEIPGKP